MLPPHSAVPYRRRHSSGAQRLSAERRSARDPARRQGGGARDCTPSAAACPTVGLQYVPAADPHGTRCGGYGSFGAGCGSGPCGGPRAGCCSGVGGAGSAGRLLDGETRAPCAALFTAGWLRAQAAATLRATAATASASQRRAAATRRRLARGAATWQRRCTLRPATRPRRWWARPQMSRDDQRWPEMARDDPR